MKTYPLKRGDGQTIAFEIPATGLWFGSLARLLQRAPGVVNVCRVRRGDTRLTFEVNGEPFVVCEPWGDNSRYWVGPVDMEATPGSAEALEAHLSQVRAWFEWPWRLLGGR